MVLDSYNLKNITELINRVKEKLEVMAIPIDEYRKIFPQGTVETPIGVVKIGKNQFLKLAEKDYGKRQKLIGAMKQTLSDPITIFEEEKDGKKASLFIKSFKTDKKSCVIVSVVVTIDNQKIAVSTYKRKIREVINKIKKAGVTTYEKVMGPT